MTRDPGRIEAYLKQRMRAIARQRPDLGAIRQTKAVSGAFHLTLHKPEEPAVRRVTGDISVTCHLVQPEEAPDAGPAATPPAVAA